MRNFLPIFLLMTLSCKPGPSAHQDKLVDLSKLDRLKALDSPLGPPQAGDWLYTHKEAGQDFEQYRNSNPVRPSATKNSIYLQPLGPFEPWQEKMLADIADYVSIFFDLKTVVLPVLQDSIIPSRARRIHDGTEQFHTKYILDQLLPARIPEDGIVLMAITARDLYPEPSWNFVFGQADLKRRIGISSFHRLLEPPLDSASQRLCLQRMMKTASHEIGHMFSIKHCTHADCVMNGSNSTSESDSRPITLCSECLKKLCWNTGFDPKERFENLQTCLKAHHLESDLRPIEASLELLEGTKYEVRGTK